MKILLTGGCGFIGSHILDEYLKKGHEVVVLDTFRSGRLENIKHNLNNKKVKLVFGNILDEKFIGSLDTDFDFINHHAAQLEITRCIDYPQEDLMTNLIGTTNIFEHAKRCKKLKGVIYASSAAVYGQAQNKLQKETDPINPHWVYGVSKYSVELLAKIYAKLLNIPFYGFRYSIVYGPREWYGRVLTIFIKNAIHNKKIIVFDKGEEVRDFVHVRDAVQANINALKIHKKGNNVYNISSGIKTSIKELAEKVCSYIPSEIIFEQVKEGKSSKVLNKDRIRLPGNLMYLCQDNTKAKKELGWIPVISLEEGLKDEIEWYKANNKKDPELWTKMFY
jgi:UDP-glucose 4-epimerase